ncbi:MAG: hypothetical protein AAF289_10275 [Cyanobacteria bacterium P01_A01_bin.135]
MGQQQDNFMGGFLVGTIIGGVLGGITGVLAASRLRSPSAEAGESPAAIDPAGGRPVTSTRRGLEDKIAQLNEAIDDVRQQLDSVEVNGDNGDQAIVSDRP